jgi:hypothetical protein
VNLQKKQYAIDIIFLFLNYNLQSTYCQCKQVKFCYIDDEINLHNPYDPFFRTLKPGVKLLCEKDKLTDSIIALKKKQLSSVDIKCALDNESIPVSVSTIQRICKDEGFSRLSTRTRKDRIAYVKSMEPIKTITSPQLIN